MRQTWTWHMVPLVCATMLVACGRDGVEDTGVAPETPRMMTVTGCVQTGPATDQFVLQNVRIDEDPLGPAPDPAVREIITEGAWVRLWNGGPVNLDQYVSQEVRVTGRLLDTGESPTGTAGAEGYETPSGDRSLQDRPDKPHWERKAAEAGPIGQESIATGREPTLQIETVNATGRPCE